MKEYIKIVIVALIAGLISGFIVAAVVGGNNQPQTDSQTDSLGGGTRFPKGISADTTAPATGEVRGTTLTITATTTLTESVDGLVVGGTISMAATGTARTVYSNTTGPKYCDADTAYLYVKNNGSFAPSLVFSMGTSTSAVATTNLIASTTVATSTTSLLQPIESKFILENGDELMVIFGDITNTMASSTYFGNWTAEAGVWCQDISI